uniref:recombinase family protein n=1 Tax=Clostridium sp. TaxID=1506 RepID=UPI0026047D62
MKKIWNVAIYARVSSVHESQESSVQEQILILKKWLQTQREREHDTEYNLIEEYIDNGCSGSNLDRDGLKKLLDDIEKGAINLVLTKDLSRLSRDHLSSGDLLENKFKNKGIRFIATQDNVDTINEIDDIVPFRNILNEFYVKDCSKKIKNSLKSRMQRGSSIASKPCYGYVFKETTEGNNKTIQLVLAGDETTEVVKEIYMLYLKGWGAGRIASYLNEKGIEPPSARLNNFARSKFGIWNNNTINSILRNPKYGGKMIQGMYKKISYKSKKIVKSDKSEWINGGDFDGIIDKNTFNKVQDMIIYRSNKSIRYKNGQIHPFSTVLICKGCNGSMTYRNKYQGYKCTNSQSGKNRCTPHSLKSEDLINILKQAIKTDINKCIDRDKYYNDIEKVEIENSHEKELKKIEKELNTLDINFKKVYEDRMNGILSERNSENMINTIQSKQEKLINRKKELYILISN